MNNKINSPAYLWIGNSYTLASRVNNYLKHYFCTDSSYISSNTNSRANSNICSNIGIYKSCNRCIACKQIDNQQHYSVRWIKPVGNYTRSDLDIIFSTIIYSLPEKQHFFFVLFDIERLNISSANSLLKSLEEPPPGYHFILLSSNKHAILPTIVSRCVIEYSGDFEEQNNKLCEYLKKPCASQAKNFISYIDSQKVTEYEVLEVIDQLEAYYITLNNTLDNTIDNTSNNLQEVLDFFKKMRLNSPMPGSAKVALKNIFLYLLALKK